MSDNIMEIRKDDPYIRRWMEGAVRWWGLGGS